MKIHQLSLFLENKPGQLGMALRILGEAGINIKTMLLSDTRQFGILHMIVPDWQKAKMALEKANCVVNDIEVVAIEVPDRPGGLAKIVSITEKAGISVEYMYAFTFGRGDKAVIIFRFEDIDAAIKALQAGGINVLSSVELYDRGEK